MESKRYTLNSVDAKKIGIGFLLAIVGAGLTYLSEVVTSVDFGQWTPVVVAGWSVLANVIRKFLSGYENTPTA